MFPMIASPTEFDAARRQLDIEMERHLGCGGRSPSSVQVGTMLEVPSLLWQLDKLVDRVDFLSIGTNDLLQFLFAADRGNTRVATRYDALSPSVLRVLDTVIKICKKHDVEASVCGEMAGQPLDALALIALGYRSLSMSASGIGPVRAMTREVHLSDIEPFIRQALNSDEGSIRERFRAFVRDRGIVLG
jgi:phosphotransferase system enzyme I (PtsP)